MIIKKAVFVINGVERAVYGDYEKDSLADVLRRSGFTGVKVGCNCGQCGTCTVIIDGAPVRACVKKFKNVPEYCRIETIEGIGLANNLHPLQKAWIKYGGVQCGFCTPGFIMSAKALLDKNPNVTRQDVRDWFTKHNNLCRCTGYKPLVDAVMAAAAVMSGKKPIWSLDPKVPSTASSIFTTDYPKPTALGKVMGATDYGDDIALKMPQGMLELAVKLPDWPHANILSIDTSEAEAMPGVIKVYTEKDVKGTNEMGEPLGKPQGHCTLDFDHRWALHGKKVRRAGDAIALVVARTREEARAAVSKIKVEYEKLPVYADALEAAAPDAIEINEGSSNVYFYQPVIKGEDTAEIFKKAESDPDVHIVKGSFRSSRQPHLALEPDATQAFYDEEGVLTVVYRSQQVELPMTIIPKVIGVDKVRVIESPTGASFGAAVRFDAGVYCAIAAEDLKMPINYTMTYAEKQIITGKRGQHFGNYKAAVDKNGKILACEFDTALETGGHSMSTIPFIRKGARFVLGAYKCENMKGVQRAIMGNNAYCVAYRGAGSPEIYTGSEQIVDMMAEAIGMDPFEFRYQNVARPGDLTPNGYPYKVYPLESMFDTFRPRWEEAKKWKAEPCEEGWKRGIGMSLGGYHVSFPVDNAEVALELMPNGMIHHYNSWEDQGQGADIGTLEFTVEALKPMGVPPEKIRVVQNDTRMCPITGVAGASRSHYMAGNATIIAANLLMDAMRKPDGTYRTYDEMVAEGIPTWYKGVYNTGDQGMFQIDPNTGQGDPMPDQNFIISIAQVEVQESTGKTRVIACHSLADVGVVGNYLALDGQAYSGIFQSQAYALTEDYSDLEKKFMTPLGCGFPKCNEIPDDFTIEYQQTPRKKGPFGSGGASECFQSASHVCFLNAVYDAVGVRVYDMPGTPEKLKAAIDKKNAGLDYAPEEYRLGDPFEVVMERIKNNPA